jgi:hypothetical protein
MIHVSGTEITVPRLLVAFFARESETFAVASGALYVVSYHHQVNNEDVCFLLPSMPYHFSIFYCELQILLLSWAGLQIQTNGTVSNIRGVGYRTSATSENHFYPNIIVLALFHIVHDSQKKTYVEPAFSFAFLEKRNH